MLCRLDLKKIIFPLYMSHTHQIKVDKNFLDELSSLLPACTLIVKLLGLGIKFIPGIILATLQK